MPVPRPIAPGLFVEDAGTPRLVCARCAICNELHFPATDTCPYCGGGATPEHVGPHGTLRLFTCVHTAPPGYRGSVPFGFGVVELDGSGLCVVTRLAEPDVTRLRPGMGMHLAIESFDGAAETEPVAVWTFVPDPT